MISRDRHPVDPLEALRSWPVVDLSVILDERFPVGWPGAAVFHHHASNTYEHDSSVATPSRGGYLTHTLILDEHTGTHFDAPSHFIPPPESGIPGAGPAGAQTGDRIDLRALMGTAAVIDCRSIQGVTAGQSPLIESSVIVEHERIHGSLAPGDAVLLWTGWSARTFKALPAGDGHILDPAVRRTSSGWPAPDVDTMRYLHQRGVRLVVIDGPSMGPVHDPAPVHMWALGNQMLFVEGCAGFGALPPRGAFFAFFPLRIAGSSGAPGRAVAFVPPSVA